MRRLAILLLGCAAAASGCGGGGGGGGGGYGGAPATTAPAAPAPAAGGTIPVTIRNYAFSPARVDARVGQTIRWTNSDTVAHNVTARGSGGFHSANLAHGASYEHKLTRRGTISYVCTIHPGMGARIVVG